MAYIGVSPSNGVRKVHTYTATASQTTFSGAGAEHISLSYRDSTYIDVYQNGVKLGDADYTATSGTSIVLAQGASVNDLVVVVVFDVFSVADTVSKADGGTFDGAVTLAGGVAGDVVFNDDSASVDFRIESNDDANMFFLDGSANAIGIRTSTDHGGQLNVETTGQAYNVVLACTDDDANHGPLLDFKRISSSPADNDLLGEISFRGRNDNTEDITYATISSTLKDASDGTEDGNLFFNVMVAGTSRELLTVTKDSVVINQDSQDIDFRVESNGNANMLFVDGGNDAVGIGNNNPASFNVNADNLVVGTTSGENGITIASGTGNSARFVFSDNSNSSNDAFVGAIEYSHSSDNMIFYNGGNQRMIIADNGNVTNSTGSYGTISDETLKENISDASSQWDDIKAIQVRKYSMKADDLDSADKIGVIAQELEKSGMNGLVEETEWTDSEDILKKDKIKTVKYSILYMKAIKALQEAMTRIETLEAEVKALKG